MQSDDSYGADAAEKDMAYFFLPPKVVVAKQKKDIGIIRNIVDIAILFHWNDRSWRQS